MIKLKLSLDEAALVAQVLRSETVLCEWVRQAKHSTSVERAEAAARLARIDNVLDRLGASRVETTHQSDSPVPGID